jgi:hypothetical protein
MVIGLSPSAAAYIKPSVQATWELPQTRVGFILDKRRSEYQCRALTRILDLIAEDGWRNV